MILTRGRIRDIIYFSFGLTIGIIFMIAKFDNSYNNGYIENKRFTRDMSKKHLSSNSETVWPVSSSIDDEHSDVSKNGKNIEEEIKNSTIKQNSDTIIEKVIRENVRVLCWIMTHPNNTYKKAIHINETWGKKCTKLLFINVDSKSDLPSVDLNVTDGRKYLWQKTKKALGYLYKTELNNYDWFLKADDDTYVIMENLRFMLLAYPPSVPVYFGCKFKKYVKQGYMSGGAGYVLSRQALKDFNEISLADPKKCKKNDVGAEDVELGRCLQNAGVIAGDSRDKHGRHRMFPLSPLYHFHGNNSTGKSLLPKWFYQYMYYPYNDTEECCSDTMISFHYVTPQLMYTIHNLLYRVYPFGLKKDNTMYHSKDNEKILEYAKKLSRLNAHKLTPPKEMQLFTTRSPNIPKFLNNTLKKHKTPKSTTTPKSNEITNSTKHP
uniref:Glycoprotein-N-acetylgalactosamine 3-beta-galactosyltransferase 1 n=1 Tax=Parastrongyloides trichosuri TaxID=131310 RepID=A0A0N4ZRH2_PARTI